MSTRSASDTRRPRASPCSMWRKATCASPRASRCKRDRLWDVRADLRFNGVAKGRQQPSGERQPDQRWSGQRAGGHPLRGCPTRHAGIPRDRHRRARHAAAGSASLSVAGTLYIRHQDGLVVAGEPGAGLPGNRPPAVPMARPSAAGALRSPAATFRDASRVSIGTLDLRDTSTQLTFDNTRPYNIATGQGVQISQLLRRRQHADHHRQRRLASRAASACLDPMPPIRPGPVSQGGQLSFLLPAEAVNGTTMLRASAPIGTQGATVAMQAAGPLKRLLRATASRSSAPPPARSPTRAPHPEYGATATCSMCRARPR